MRTIDVRSITLEPLKAAAVQQVPRYLAESLEFDVIQQDLLRTLSYRLSGAVLAQRGPAGTRSVPFSGTRHAEIPVKSRGLLLPFLLAAVLCFAGLLVASFALVAGSGLTAALAVVLLCLNPAGTVTAEVPVDGTVDVEIEHWCAFPDAELVPRELGKPVMFALTERASYTARPSWL